MKAMKVMEEYREGHEGREGNDRDERLASARLEQPCANKTGIVTRTSDAPVMFARGCSRRPAERPPAGYNPPPPPPGIRG